MTELERWSPIVAYCADETKIIHSSMSEGLLKKCKERCLELINADCKFREAAHNYLNDEYEKLIKRYDAAFEDVKNKIIFSRVAYRMSIKEKKWETKDKSRRFTTRLYINNLDLAICTTTWQQWEIKNSVILENKNYISNPYNVYIQKIISKKYV